MAETNVMPRAPDKDSIVYTPEIYQRTHKLVSFINEAAQIRGHNIGFTEM